MTSRATHVSIGIFLLLIALTPITALSQIPLNSDSTIRLTGDIRAGYIGFIGEQRSGDRLSQHELRNRTRIGIDISFTDRITFHTRYAIRVSSLNFHLYPHINTSAPGNNGLLMGEGAFDQFFASMRFSERFTIKAGRFQTSFTLDGIIKNSILRQDSPNTDVSWTDGLHLTAKSNNGWTSDLIIQSHLHNASTNVFRYPLVPDKSDVPVTFFGSIKKEFGPGALSSLALNLTYSPDALLMNSNGNRSGYIAASFKPQFRKTFTSGRRLLWGTEIAYSFNRPQRTVTGIYESPGSPSGGFGFQTVLSVMDLFKNHHLGVMAAVLEPSLLTSSAFWNNLLLFEVRHSARLSNKLSTDIRLRYRADLRSPGLDFDRRRQLYPFARITYKI